ncbi:unnamed protein product [Auanema sp. JU1783]|nr:unnamed protein product [Auanema sp. JU1783]
MYRALIAQQRASIEEAINDKENLHRRQSPIDISTKNCIFDGKLCDAHSFNITYTPGDCERIIINPGKGWQVAAVPNATTSLTASHLKSTYRFLQFHAHWGSTSDCGSEHTIDGKRFASEIHFVFWNSMYSSPAEAQTRSDGLAVVGVFVEEGNYNADFAYVTSQISEALNNDNVAYISNDFDMNKMIPSGSDLVHYTGSLTTPPYTECVMWTVLLNPVQISSNQLFHFRKICSDNWRECQHLYGRQTFSSKSF